MLSKSFSNHSQRKMLEHFWDSVVTTKNLLNSLNHSKKPVSSLCPLETAAALQSLRICRPMVSKVTVTTSSSHHPPEHTPFTGRAVPTIIGWELILLQLNVKGISKAKLEIISHLATENKATTILLQETHATRPDMLTIPGYSLAAHTISDS